MTELPLDSIKIGSRVRQDHGDIGSLATNIANVGLLHPIVVTLDGSLIAGARRLMAFKTLGRETIPVTVVDLERIVLGEYAENTFRKQFTPSECADIADALEPIERGLAKERQLAGKPPENFSEGGEARHKIAKAAGKSAPSIAKARAVRDAAKVDPEKFGKLQADMDRTGRVDGPFKRLKVMRQAAEIRKEPPPLPGRGPYRVIVADPPWPYEIRKADPSHRATHPFPQMSIEQICALSVAQIAHEDCLLWLWTTNHHMREAFTVLDAWRFNQKTILTWIKNRMGTGDWLRGQTEHCLLAVRGKPVVELTNQTTLLHGPLRANSQKPVEFYGFIERLCPAPRYAYLFSRYRHSERWDCHGDEAPGPRGRRMSALPPLLAIAQGRKARPRRAPVTRPEELALRVIVAKILRDHCRADWQWCHVPAGAPHAVARTIDEALVALDAWGCLRIKLTAGAP